MGEGLRHACLGSPHTGSASTASFPATAPTEPLFPVLYWHLSVSFLATLPTGSHLRGAIITSNVFNFFETRTALMYNYLRIFPRTSKALLSIIDAVTPVEERWQHGMKYATPLLYSA